MAEEWWLLRTVGEVACVAASVWLREVYDASFEAVGKVAVAVHLGCEAGSVAHLE